MGINITKNDIAWSYIAKFFQVAAGFITLPFTLHILSKEEIGLNYLMGTISAMVALIDFGFSPQFGRNFAMINSGAQKLLKEGVDKTSDSGNIINYHLLQTTIQTAQFVYRRLSLIAFILMITIGSIYMYYVTNGFTIIKHSFIIWIIFSISIYFNVYFSYYTGLLSGSGKIAESNQASILSKLAYIVISISMLYLGCGLFSIVIASLLSPFVQRFYAYKKYFTPELKSKFIFTVSKEDIKETYNIIWYNAKKLGINFVCVYVIMKFGMFLAGLYLPLSDVASYGLLVQLTGILVGLGTGFYMTLEPQLISYNVIGESNKLQQKFSMSLVVFYVVMIIGGLAITYIVPIVLDLIKSNTLLPSSTICLLYILIISLEYNHSIFGGLIATENKFPFVKAYVISSIGVLVLTFFFLQFTSFGILGVVLAEGIVELSYNNWHWPIVGCKRFGLNFKMIIAIGTKEIAKQITKISQI